MIIILASLEHWDTLIWVCRSTKAFSQDVVFETAQTYVSRILCRCIVVITLLTLVSVLRARDDDPGLHDAEAGFIRLLDKLTNGSKVRPYNTYKLV